MDSKLDQAAHGLGHQEAAVDDSHAAHHIVPPKVYALVLVALLILTWLTVSVAYMNFGGIWNLVLALGVATIKATLVVLFFMHVKYSGRLVHLTIGASLLFFILLIAGTLMDVYTRSNVVPFDQPAPSGRYERNEAGRVTF